MPEPDNFEKLLEEKSLLEKLFPFATLDKDKKAIYARWLFVSLVIALVVSKAGSN